MRGSNRHIRIAKDVPLVIAVAVVGTGALVYWDAYEWFYEHSRPHEAYDYDEIATSLTLFLVVGMLWMLLRLYRETSRDVAQRIKAEAALTELNRSLEQRIEQRTSELQRELDERRRMERKLIENQKRLRALSSELALVEERARHRVAVDLHDNIGHLLAIASNQLEMLRGSISTDQGSEILNSTKKLVKDSIRYSRFLISELDSPLFYNLPFVSAMEWMIRDILEKGPIAVHLEADEEPKPLADSARMLFFKAIEETLVNIVKHAQALNVEISVRTLANDIVVEIEDDGIGFDERAVLHSTLDDGQGFGIFIIRERLVHLGGSYSIRSNLGRGTCVTLTVPMHKDLAESG